MKHQDTDFVITKLYLEEEKKEIESEITKAIQKIRETCDRYEYKKTQLEFGHLLKVSRLKEITEKVISSFDVSETVPLYVIGSWFLYDCYQYLTKEPVESLHYVTGTKLGNLYTLDRICTFKLDIQTIAHARGNIASSHKALIEMDEYGHRLHAHFHSHPGKGAGATQPSLVDDIYQKGLEKGGYSVIGGIFSRDGFLRFFSSKRQFRIKIYGEGVEVIDDKIYRLTKAKTS
ncbi:hypothetical protein KAW65_00415 [candidate division WOR-3 bacterium]|nr:hypothetical protein [candidate division WOR-3 bacterium]